MTQGQLPRTRSAFNERLAEVSGVPAEEAREMLSSCAHDPASLPGLLVSKGFATPEGVKGVYVRDFGFRPFRAEDVSGPLPQNPLPVRFMRENLAFPVSEKNGCLTLAVADPLAVRVRESVAKATGRRVIPVVGTEEEVREAIEKVYGEGASSMERLVEQVAADGEGPQDVAGGDVERLIGAASEAPIIRIVNFLIARAIERGASDIHIEPYERNLKVRYRVDGILTEVEPPPKRLQTAVISRVKIMSKLNIAESRLPQDGRVKLRIGGKEIDFRVSTVPTLHGENVVIRILDQSAVPLDLSSLGLSREALSDLRRAIRLPHGMVLVTGPTGSGKTTTLYGALQEIRGVERKIVTIEDPVEYQIPGISQIQVKPQIGLTFASGLRSIVRQDPDVILVGEIRDRETAEIAIHAALTGHMVLSTLHTNDAAGAVTRLLEMGVEEYLLPSSLTGVLAQRLVRTVCQACAAPFSPSEALRAEVVREAGRFPEGELRFGAGCPACSGTGYRGRIGIFEWLPVEQEVKDLILTRADAVAIRKKAVSLGMGLLRDDGLRKVSEGVTTVEEVLRVTRS